MGLVEDSAIDSLTNFKASIQRFPFLNKVIHFFEIKGFPLHMTAD